MRDPKTPNGSIHKIWECYPQKLGILTPKIWALILVYVNPPLVILDKENIKAPASGRVIPFRVVGKRADAT